MSEESGGGAPRRGFNFQDYAAAYFFVSDEPTFRAAQPLELHIEQDGSDFSYFIRNSDNEIAHYFEVKEKQEGELKWSKFKNSILPEFASIMEDSPRFSDTTIFHTVVNTAFARKIGNLHDDAEKLRQGQLSWPGLSTRRERRYDTIRSATDLEDDEEGFYRLIWGLFGHAISESELDSRLESYLRSCAPRKHRMAKQVILNEIHETDTGIIRRDELEEEIGFTLKPLDDSTSGDTTEPQHLRGEVENISQSYPSKEDRTSELVADKSSTQEYVEWLSEEAGADESVVETHGTHLEEAFEERIEIERRKSELDHSIGQITNTLLDLDDSTSSEGDAND